jgi:hypothetical protein
MLHNDRRSLENYVAKHNRYSTLEARALIREAREGTVKDATELDQGVAIRRWLKRNVFPRLPLSFLIRFIYMYIGRLGILDGANGLRFCLFLASYDLFIHLKMVEVRESDPSLSQPYRPANGLSIPEGMMGPTDSQRASS